MTSPNSPARATEQGGCACPEAATLASPVAEHEAYDVVVVGAGLAGLRAAIAAAEAGADTLLISKAPPQGTTSAIAWGAASGAVGGTSPETYLAQLEEKAQGAGDPSRRRLLAEETGQRLEELSRFGVPLQVGRSHVRVEGPFAWPALSMIEPLVAFARGLGVRFRFGSAATGLLQRGDAVCGLLARDAGRLLSIRAGAVVLCGGGFTGLYPRNDSIGGNLGDCLALGLLAGARLVDMEFVSVRRPGLAEEGRRMDCVYANPLVAAGRWLTPEGVPLAKGDVEEYFRRRAGVVDRLDERYDLLCDLSDVAARLGSDEALAAARDEFLADWPLTERPVRISPMAHYAFGGLAIDADGFTGVPGLYAAGECTGGVLGAERPGGAALADCIVFGARAGEAAASSAAGHAGCEPDVGLELKCVGEAQARELRGEAGWALGNYASLYKHAEGLEAARRWLEELSARLAEAPPAADPSPAVSHEAAVAVPVAQAAVLASALRAETRGSHQRLDYPEADPELAFRSHYLDAGGVAVHAVRYER